MLEFMVTTRLAIQLTNPFLGQVLATVDLNRVFYVFHKCHNILQIYLQIKRGVCMFTYQFVQRSFWSGLYMY